MNNELKKEEKNEIIKNDDLAFDHDLVILSGIERLKNKLEYIKGIKDQINPILIQKIRYLTLIGKK